MARTGFSPGMHTSTPRTPNHEIPMGRTSEPDAGATKETGFNLHNSFTEYLDDVRDWYRDLYLCANAKSARRAEPPAGARSVFHLTVRIP